jgi:glycosyltransferase involved in cell wall biosynthesis
MNIAIVVAGLPPERIGGAEIQAAQMAARLSSRHAVTVFTRTSAVPPELAAEPACSVVRRCGVRIPGIRFAADIVQTLTLVGRSRPRPDVILAYQTTIDGLIAVLAKIVFGIPVVVSVRSDMEYRLDRFRQSRLFSPFVFRHADRVAVQSPNLAEELFEALDRGGHRRLAAALRPKLFVLPNGVEPTDGRRLEPGGVGFVGRLIKEKDVDTLIVAMRDCPGESLTIVGDGPERRHLEGIAGKNSNVSFIGAVGRQRARTLLSNMKLLVVPSRHEGQPNVVLEAMADGVPVVATRVGGMPDLIAHGRTGWLVEPGDAQGLAAAIRTLCADDGLRRRLASQAAEEARKYAWPEVTADLERQLLAITAAANGSRPHQPVRAV